MDGRLAVLDVDGGIRWIHTDHQGSTAAVTDGAGIVHGAYAYSPYGESNTTGGSLGANLSWFGYTGREFDAETGNYQYRARYYHPTLGRFLSTDPIGTKDDPNLYFYVGGDPVNRTDPTGMCFWDACVVEGTAAVVATGLVVACVATECLRPAAEAIVNGVGAVWDWLTRPVYHTPIVEVGDPVLVSDGEQSSDGEQAQEEGCVYCVPGPATQSGDDYVGSTDNAGDRFRDSRDGRDRSQAEIIGRYPKGDRDARRNAEQQAINDRGGVENLDNKRNEVSERDWRRRAGIRPPE